nr:hypothetical protein GCM10017745_63450 [Saccharothrix mutabilis subsp. capreolus]
MRLSLAERATRDVLVVGDTCPDLLEGLAAAGFHATVAQPADVADDLGRPDVVLLAASLGLPGSRC